MINNIIKKFQRMRQHQKIMKECDESSKRMMMLTREECDSLKEEVINLSFPQGYWCCQNHKNIQPRITIGSKCPICESIE